MIRRLARAVRRRAPQGDGGAAMVTTLMAIMITGMLSILLLGIITSQLMPTTFLRTSSRTVFAAEAGLNAVVGQIRTADGAPDITGTVYGDTSKLPCTAEGPVVESGSQLRYDATVRYYLLDPRDRTDSWLATHQIACTPGAGPAIDPAYALVTSTGSGGTVAGLSGGTADRTVQVVYEFQITNNNIPGGLIYSFDPAYTPDRFCLEAESATAGAEIKYVNASTCGTDDVHQLWIYDSSYQIKLASTTVPSLGIAPLCITGPSGGGMPQRAKLQECKSPTDPARWNQLFSWEGGAKWRGQQSSISGGYANVWLYSGTASGSPSGRYLHVGGSSPSNNEWGSFNPDPRVGAGAAGKNTNQIVNYLEFGRCTDVTDEDVNKTFMIVYPCKQDPIPGQPNLLWNHKWYYDEPAGEIGSRGPQQISVYRSGTRYCLVSPNSEGGYVRLTSSCSTSANNQKFTRHANTGNYASSYTFTDNWGRCLSLGDKYATAWSKITTATCNSGLGQKWNAPPNTINASLDGYQEIP